MGAKVHGALGTLYINMHENVSEISRSSSTNLFNFIEVNIHDVGMTVRYINLLICAFSPLPWSSLPRVSPPLKENIILAIINVTDAIVIAMFYT